jgi:hypothetical protein
MSLANITGIQEIDFMHMVHIADEVTADESALWVVIVDTIILVSGVHDLWRPSLTNSFLRP